MRNYKEEEFNNFKDMIKRVMGELSAGKKPVIIQSLHIMYCSGGGAKILIDSEDIDARPKEKSNRKVKRTS